MNRNPPTSITITPTTKAVVLILISVFANSTIPLFIAIFGIDSPFIFASVWGIGNAGILVVFMFLFYRRLFLNPEVWKLAWRYSFSLPMVAWIIMKLDYALFAWSAGHIDVSITTALYETWPILMISLTAWLFRDSERYHKIGAVVYFAFFLAVGGAAVVILGKSETFAAVTSASAEISLGSLVIGVVLALFAAFLASFSAYGFKWAVDFARSLPDTPDHTEGSREVFSVMLGTVLSRFFATPFVGLIGFARDEPVVPVTLSLVLIVISLVSVVATLSWRWGNLMTERLDINVIAYLTPLLSLCLLLVFGKVGDVNLTFLFVGAGIIIAANLLIFIYDSRVSKEDSELDDQIKQTELALRKTVSDTLDNELSAIPSHITKRMQDRRRSTIRQNPALNIRERESLISLLDYSDLRELEEIICHRSLWENFEASFGSKSVVSMRFNQLAELRNAIRHSRVITEIVRRDGETAIIWFQEILDDVS